ncbi:MAG: YebC/PmpR family DNA-binding transcriptional regulator [bacterium]|nr:YebC/PmpR family DNA-binding transcriptional regulator [bacterium]
MSKHSKWAKIKRAKGVTDVKRGVIFSKLSRNITIAAREGTDVTTNFKLRMAIDRALAENMPKDNIERAVERAAKNEDGTTLESLTIDARGLSGSALLIDVVTDNRNRSFGELRKLLGDHGCHPTEPGSMQWLFERRGQIFIENVTDIEQAELDAIDTGASEIDNDETMLEVITNPEQLHAITESLKNKKYQITSSELMMHPKTSIALAENEYNKLQELMEILEDHADVAGVTTNAVPA